MHGRQQVHEPGQLVIVRRPDHEVKVVGHDAVGEQADRNTSLRLGSALQKRPIVTWRVEEPEAAHAAVQDVEDNPCSAGLAAYGHDPRMKQVACRKKTSGVFFTFS
jgi:hypothetical protein